MLALGVRGGVPQKAADVCLHEHLKDSFPAMADQVIRPEKLLLPSKRRPGRVKRGYTWLASSYPELVRRNVRAGLHRLKKPHQVARHRGVVCLAELLQCERMQMKIELSPIPASINFLIQQSCPGLDSLTSRRCGQSRCRQEGFWLFRSVMLGTTFIACRSGGVGDDGCADRRYKLHHLQARTAFAIQPRVRLPWGLVHRRAGRRV